MPDQKMNLNDYLTIEEILAEAKLAIEKKVETIYAGTVTIPDE